MSRRAGGRWHRLVSLAVDHAQPLILTFCALALLAGGYAAFNLKINTSTTDMIAREVPFRQNAIRFEQAFPQFDAPLVAVIEGASADQAEAAARRLAGELRRRPDQFEAVEYLPAHPFFMRHGLLLLETPELERLSERLAEAQPLLAVLAADPTLQGLAEFLDLALGEAPANEPALGLDRLLQEIADVVGAVDQGRPASLSWRRLLDPGRGSGRAREVVLAQPRLDHASLSPAADAIDVLQTAAREIGITAEGGLVIRLTGDAVLQQEELQSVRGNALLAAAITTTGVAILLVVGLGTWRLIVPVLATLAVGLLLTAAAALLTIGRLNLISVTFAVLFIGLGVDFGIHLVLRVREVLAAGEPGPAAIVRGSSELAPALSLSAVTAALGFLAFVPTEYRGLAELGVISAGGMAIALLTSVTLLPALLAVVGPERAPTPVSPGLRPAMAVDRPRLVLPVALLLGGLSALALPRVGFDFDPLNLKDPASESVRTFQMLAEDPRTSPYTIDLVADAGAAPALAERLRAVDEVGSVLTLEGFVPEDQAAKLELLDSLALFLLPVLGPPARQELDEAGRRAAFSHLLALAGAARLQTTAGGAALATALRDFAAEPAEAGRLEALERALTGTLPALIERLRTALDAGPVDIADLPAELVERWRTEDDRRRLLVRPARPISSNAELAAFVDAVLAVEPSATGTPVIVRQAGKAVLEAFETASWVAFTTIALVLALVLRNVLDVLLVLLPIVLAVLYTAASAVLLGLELNFANVIVLPLLLGLGVSGAIHVVLRARKVGTARGIDLSSTPRAVLFSALTTIASFGSLAISEHRGLASMGQLLTVAILWSLVCTLIVLPNLLALRRGREAGR